jgi:hypothetical protein
LRLIIVIHHNYGISVKYPSNETRITTLNRPVNFALEASRRTETNHESISVLEVAKKQRSALSISYLIPTFLNVGASNAPFTPTSIGRRR